MFSIVHKIIQVPYNIRNIIFELSKIILLVKQANGIIPWLEQTIYNRIYFKIKKCIHYICFPFIFLTKLCTILTQSYCTLMHGFFFNVITSLVLFKVITYVGYILYPNVISIFIIPFDNLQLNKGNNILHFLWIMRHTGTFFHHETNWTEFDQ